MTDKTNYLYAIENWGGDWAVSYYVDHGDGRMAPQQDWTPISAGEASAIMAAHEPFVTSKHYGITYYSLDAQCEYWGELEALDAFIDALTERNRQGLDAAAGVL